jgi:hypothetical protein
MRKSKRAPKVATLAFNAGDNDSAVVEIDRQLAAN